MLYGCELYMVDSHLDICINTKDILLNNADYVIFDLETTGLSARYDRIIEFGATNTLTVKSMIREISYQP